MDKLAIVLAAGEGTRMKSHLPKVLHPICSQPMIEYVLKALETVCDEKILVVGHQKEKLMEACHDMAKFVVQDSSTGWGTGHAVKCAMSHLEGRKGTVIVTAGDMPLVMSETYERLAKLVSSGYSAALLTDIVDNPIGYGRIVRENGSVVKIVEQRDLIGDQHLICEMNASVYCFDIEALLWALPQLTNKNAAYEYYLTDVIAILAASGHKVTTVPVLDKSECMGINDRIQLASADKMMRRRINNALMKGGVTMIDPDTVYIAPDAHIGMDTIIYPGCVIESGTVIGEGCTLLPNSRISASKIGNNVKIESSVLLEATVGDGTTVGPFAYLRPGTRVGQKCRIGDFVEIKNSVIDDGTKVSHLTYVGDSDLGKNINLGCGVVFVNYDGKRKYRSKVGDNAFIGCNVNLVSPVTIGEGAYIAAGSTVTNDVEDNSLAIARARQENKINWVLKRKLEGKI